MMVEPTLNKGFQNEYPLAMKNTKSTNNIQI